MRLLLAASISIGVGLSGCKSEADPPIYLDTEYQVRCIDCQPRTSDDPRHKIMLLDGEEDWSISCTVDSVGGKPTVTLNAANSDDYSLRITRATIGSDPSDACSIRVTEGANSYEGKCTGDEPDEDSPCQVSFEEGDDGILEGELLCHEIPNEANLGSVRYVVDPGGDKDDAVKLEVHNCRGL